MELLPDVAWSIDVNPSTLEGTVRAGDSVFVIPLSACRELLAMTEKQKSDFDRTQAGLPPVMTLTLDTGTMETEVDLGSGGENVRMEPEEAVARLASLIRDLRRVNKPARC